MEIPKTFNQALKLVDSVELTNMLKAQMIVLAFRKENANTALRACEILYNMPRATESDPFEGLSDDELLEFHNELQVVYDKYLKD